jgi:hypothetical protein
VSGGSFEYLYRKDEFETYLLEYMAEDLARRGMFEAEEATRALIQKPSQALRDLWHAVEWNVSGDWPEARVAEAYVAFKNEQPADLSVEGRARNAYEKRHSAYPQLPNWLDLPEHARDGWRDFIRSGGNAPTPPDEQ